MSEQLTDQTLVEKAQQGDKKAFNLLVARHQNKVAGLLTRYVSANDIPDVVNRYLHPEAEASRTRKDQSFFVPVEEIRQNDYDLSINKYKEIEREKVEYEPVKDILVRLEENEGKFLKGYRNLCKMLEEDEKKEEMV